MAGSCPEGPRTPVTCGNLGSCPALTRQDSNFDQDRIGGLLPGKFEHRWAAASLKYWLGRMPKKLSS